MKIRKITASMMAGLLAVSAATPAKAAELAPAPARATASTAESAIRVSSVKGNTLNPGDRSFLMIGPYGEDYAAASDAPEIVDAEQVLGFWVAMAKMDGKATITVTNKAGASGAVEITVGAGAPAPISDERNPTLDDNLEIRQEMIRLINQARRENGVAELPANASIMDAAQDISATRPTGHSLYEFESLEAHGWMHGGGVNLTRFNGRENLRYLAEHAVQNWMKSTYHRQTLLDDCVTCLGVGVTVYNGTAYCVMIVGDPNSISPIG